MEKKQVRRLVASVVLANASDALLDERCFRQTLRVVSELWRGFRSHCKVELAVLLEGFLLKTLRAGSPQVITGVDVCQYPAVFHHLVR